MFKKILSLIVSGIIIFTGLGIDSFAATKTDNDYIKYLVKENVDNIYYVDEENMNVVVIVSEKSLTSDGLCASGLVGASNALFLPVDESKQSYQSIDKMLKNGRRKIDSAYIIGGEKSISNKFERGLVSLGYKCKRIKGKDRIETSFKIANEVNKLTNVKEYAVARAYKGDADAVSIAYQSKNRKMPILLSKDGKNLNYNTKGKKVYAIGGKSVLSNSLVKNLNARRLGGSDRFRTNEAIIKYFKEDKLSLVDGSNERLGIAILASNYTRYQPALSTEKSYKGNLPSKGFWQSYIPMTKKKDQFLENISYHATIKGREKFIDNLHKKARLKKYDYVFYGVDYFYSGLYNSKHIKDYQKNYYAFTPFKVIKGEDGYWTIYWKEDMKEEYYLVNKHNGKVYKYDEKKDIHKLI